MSQLLLFVLGMQFCCDSRSVCCWLALLSKKECRFSETAESSSYLYYLNTVLAVRRGEKKPKGLRDCHSSSRSVESADVKITPIAVQFAMRYCKKTDITMSFEDITVVYRLFLVVLGLFSSCMMWYGGAPDEVRHVSVSAHIQYPTVCRLFFL